MKNLFIFIFILSLLFIISSCKIPLDGPEPVTSTKHNKYTARIIKRLCTPEEAQNIEKHIPGFNTNLFYFEIQDHHIRYLKMVLEQTEKFLLENFCYEKEQQ